MIFWIEPDKQEKAPLHFVNIDQATKFLLKAKNVLIKDELAKEYWLTNFLYVDLLRIKKEEEALELWSQFSEIDQHQFKWHQLRALASTHSITDLLKEVPKHNDYGATIIAHRLIAEGYTNEFLDKLEFQSLSFDVQKEILNQITNYDKNISLVLKLFKSIKTEKAHSSTFGLTYLIADQLKNNELNLEEALELLSEFELTRENYFRIATSCAESGNMNRYKNALELLTDGPHRIWNLTNAANSIYFNLPHSAQLEFITLLKAERKTKETKMYVTLLEKTLVKDFKIDKSLIDFCKAHKKLQPDDLIFNFLFRNKRYKDCLELIDKIQGRNRFTQYEASLTALLNQGNYEYAIEKAMTITDNHTRAQIVNRLLELDKYDLAEALTNQIFKTKKLRQEWTNQYFIISHVRQNRIESAEKLIAEEKSSSRKIGYYHQLGRLCLGLKYGSSG